MFILLKLYMRSKQMTYFPTNNVTAVFAWGHPREHELISSLVHDNIKRFTRVIAFVKSKEEEEIFALSNDDKIIYHRFCDGELLEQHIPPCNHYIHDCVLLYVNADTIDHCKRQRLLEGIIIQSNRIDSSRIKFRVILNCGHVNALTLTMRANLDNIIVFPTPIINDVDGMELQPSEQIMDLIGLEEYTSRRIRHLTTAKKGHVAQFNLCDILWSNEESVFVEYIELPQ